MSLSDKKCVFTEKVRPQSVPIKKQTLYGLF